MGRIGVQLGRPARLGSSPITEAPTSAGPTIEAGRAGGQPPPLVGRTPGRQHAMAAGCWVRCGRCTVLPLALLVVTALLTPANADDKKEVPHAAAHKQIVYRYIPIDKSFLDYDRKYDDYYKTSPISENARRDYSSGYSKGYSGRLDSYDQLYNNDYRRQSDDYYYDHPTGTGGGGNVDTYSSYSRGDSNHHGLRDNRRHSHDSSEYYDYDYSHDHTPQKRPQRRSKVKKKKPKSMSTRLLDFTEAVIRR